ncbi:hypothetical protein COO60DRAFT_1461216 [Scenedesmus sp. NREL 46B-D3]|nr:hypothetical protein COO60DRAFT_1461216 [Scenedesmus sp. NREL 46B-D3]
MNLEPGSPVAGVGLLQVPGAQPTHDSSNVGAAGQLSTPELLAKRLQRQQAEREALAGLCSRPNLARRLLQPLQLQQQQHVQAPVQQSAAVPGSSTTNVLSRPAKRPLMAPKPSAMEPEQPTGVSADELAELLNADGPAEDSPAKRIKFADMPPTHNVGYSFKFMSKSAVHAGSRRFRRVTKSGKLIVARRQAPHMAGQGAEFVDGFAGGASGGGTSGKGRCFKCGQAGHWAADCPLIAASIAAQEAEMADEAELKTLAGVAADVPWQPEALGDEQLQAVLRGVWGHQGFRGQQLPLVRSALEGRSMLGVLPTGLGKSLTYQLPALLLQGEVLGRAAAGQLRLLYVAPEKLSAAPVMQCLAALHPLPLVCVDEAHCMAEWGQGFRPAYFRLGHLLRNVLRPRAVLALTATATPVTRTCIRQLLAIPPEQQLVESPLRSNLRLQVAHLNGASKGGGIATQVVQLLTTGELASASSVVVYAGFKAAADSLAAQLQRAQVSARPYHAGLTMQQREAVQTAFLSGAIRVVVATVAFGMGVDKQDLDAVLHTCMPHSMEEYVQQVGRAGRDGRLGSCMLFLDDADYVKLRALAHAGTAQRGSVELFLAKVFGREAEYEAQQAADAEADGRKRRKQPSVDASRHRRSGAYITALPNAAAVIDVRFHRTAPEQLAEHHPVVAAILSAKCRKYAGTHKVHMPALLAAADRPPGELLSELAGLAGAHEVGLDLGREGALTWRLERQPADWQRLVTDMVARLEQGQRIACDHALQLTVLCLAVCCAMAWAVWSADLGRAKFTGLALARLLAGLASPAVPASTWKGSSEWGRLAATDFSLLVEVGEKVAWSGQLNRLLGNICMLHAPLTLLVGLCFAFPRFQDEIPAIPIVAGQPWGGVGHVAREGGGQRNPFGKDFDEAGYQWTPELCRKDSDGDGFTNGQELGDPDCTWLKGWPKRTAATISHPGLANSVPTPAVASGK